jgi:transposase
VFLTHFARAYPDSLNLVLLDNGPCLTAKGLQLSANVVFIPLPPYSPELNPIERLWRELKDLLAPFLFTHLSALESVA